MLLGVLFKLKEEKYLITKNVEKLRFATEKFNFYKYTQLLQLLF